MAHNALVKIAEDAYVNFYEIASVEGTEHSDEVLIVLKNGHKIVLENTTPRQVTKRIAAHISGDHGNIKRDFDFDFED